MRTSSAVVYSEYRQKGYEVKYGDVSDFLDLQVLEGIRHWLVQEHDWHVLVLPVGETVENKVTKTSYIYVLTHGHLTPDFDLDEKMKNQPHYQKHVDALQEGLRKALTYL